MYGYLADAVVIAHVLYCAYIVLGQVAITVAAPFRWAWARNPWFRVTHLAAIGYVALEVAMGWRCPLTIWEEKLRVLGGGTVADTGESFVGRLAHNTLFLDNLPEIFFDTVHVAMATLVLQGFMMFPPRVFRAWRSRRQSPSSSPSTEPDFMISANSTVA